MIEGKPDDAAVAWAEGELRLDALRERLKALARFDVGSGTGCGRVAEDALSALDRLTAENERLRKMIGRVQDAVCEWEADDMSGDEGVDAVKAAIRRWTTPAPTPPTGEGGE